jgi:serine phosphatase RsbU (regulator of sigma subunit)
VLMDRAVEQTLEAPWSSASFDRMTLSHHAVSADDRSKGGDWCETFAVTGSQLGISIGDVCGHDAAASRLMVEIRCDIRFETYPGRDPATVLHAVNERFWRRGTSSHATSIFGIIDIPTQMLTFASAGHPGPLVMESNRSRFLRSKRSDMPIGIQPSLQMVTHRVSLEPDTLLVFYTDGVVELERDVATGERRLREAARRAYHAPGSAAADAIADHLQLSRRKDDDASILTIRTAPAGMR